MFDNAKTVLDIYKTSKQTYFILYQSFARIYIDEYEGQKESRDAYLAPRDWRTMLTQRFLRRD